MENLSESLVGAFIGVIGTVIGTIIGALLPVLQNSIGKKSIHLSNVEVHWGDGSRDSLGSYNVSRLRFRLSILNKKGKDLILENMSCSFYSAEKLLCTSKCYDADSYQNIACRAVYDELVYLDVPHNSSKTINIHLSFNKDFTSCDKVIFNYSWGLYKRKLLVWNNSD